MAGVKGRSGGARPGAGRKPKGYVRPPEVADSESSQVQRDDPKVYGSGIDAVDDPKDFLAAYMNDSSVPGHERRQAAQALMPYFHMKREDGKKKQRQEAAVEAASKFPTPAGPPKLSVVS